MEVFFKTCKSTLNLIGECRSLSYDTLTAHVAIVFTRYMLLALEQRKNVDQRTLGELFFCLIAEMSDITFSRSLGIIMSAMIASLQELLKLSDDQLKVFTADFEARLPEYLRNALHPASVVAYITILLAEILNFQGAKPILGMGSFSQCIHKIASASLKIADS